MGETVTVTETWVLEYESPRLPDVWSRAWPDTFSSPWTSEQEVEEAMPEVRSKISTYRASRIEAASATRFRITKTITATATSKSIERELP